jgi:hypothetical protein
LERLEAVSFNLAGFSLITDFFKGKSTFINYLANYFKRGKVDNPKIAIPTRFHGTNMDFSHKEKSVNDVTTSKTADCHCYTFELEGIDFHFIDTPGISDTGGLIQDSRNVEKIFGYIEQLPEITALVLIINGAVSRATVNIRHVLSTFQQHVPDVVYNNMLIVLTNCHLHTVSFQPSDFGLPTGCPVFHMQNSAFSSDFHQWSDRTRNIMQQDFQNSMNTISQLIMKFLQLEPQSTAKFKDMDDDRNSIKRELHDARMMLMDLQHLEDELVGYELSAGIHSTNVEKFRNFVQFKDVMRLERIPTNYHSTTCSICNKVCHENCRLNEVPFTGDKTFLRCAVMKHGYCQKCRCDARSHYHDRSIVRLVKRTFQESLSSLEERYREAKAGKERADIECNNIQETKKIIESELRIQYNKVKESVERLRRTCSGINVSTELYDFIVGLKKDVATLKASSVINKTNIFIADLEQLCKNMENAEILTTVNNDHQQPSPPPVPARKSIFTGRRKTLVPQISATSNGFRSIPAVSKSIELSRPKSTEVVAGMIDISPPVMIHRGQSSDLQVAEDKVGVNDFFDAPDSFVPRKCADEPIVILGNMTNSSSEKQGRRATSEIGIGPDEAEVDFATFTLSALIKASKRIQNKEIRKELENRCRGKSLGLLSNTQHLQLCKHFAELQWKDLKQLIRMRDQLENDIQEATSSDPFNIEEVSETKLLQLAAANLLILSDPIESSV